MGPVKWLKRGAAIRKYVRVLSPELRKRYGNKKSYSGAEISTAVADLGLSKEFILYAIALYSTKNEYSNFYQKSNSPIMDYATSRSIALSIGITQMAWSSGTGMGTGCDDSTDINGGSDCGSF